MKRRVRLTENDLHNIIKRSVKRILKEAEEYDWDYSEEDLPFIKKVENDASWNEKEAADRNLRDASLMWDMESFPPSYNYRTDFGAGYDGGISDEEFDKISDDANEFYYEKGPHRFSTNTKWEDEDFPLEDDDVEEFFTPSSIYNRPYVKK